MGKCGLSCERALRIVKSSNQPTIDPKDEDWVFATLTFVGLIQTHVLIWNFVFWFWPVGAMKLAHRVGWSGPFNQVVNIPHIDFKNDLTGRFRM